MKRALKTILARLGYRVQNTSYCPRQLLESNCLRPIEFDDLICRRMFECGSELNFIQVGAFDGLTCDPLQRYIDRCGWRGILVEPQPTAANQLNELYRANERVVVIQAVLDSERGTRILFTVESESGPAWAGGLASFDRQSIVKHSDFIPGLEEMIKEVNVECITFDDVLETLPSDRFDLLQIDTEGADAHILSLFPFDDIKPAIIHWEVKHLNKNQREECLARLASFGYRFAPSGDQDMMAVL